MQLNAPEIQKIKKWVHTNADYPQKNISQTVHVYLTDTVLSKNPANAG